MLSAAQDDAGLFAKRYGLCIETVGAVAVGCGGLLILSGSWLVPTLYGQTYSAAVPVFVWLVLAHACRLMRQAPTLAAMARADTRIPLVANTFRLCGLATAATAVALGLSLSWIAAAAVVGELIAMLAVLVLVGRRHGMNLAVGLRSFLVTFGALAIVQCASLFGLLASHGWSTPICALCVAGLVVLLLVFFPIVRTEVLRAVRTWQLRRVSV